jgi:hypothetical protein
MASFLFLMQKCRQMALPEAAWAPNILAAQRRAMEAASASASAAAGANP